MRSNTDSSFFPNIGVTRDANTGEMSYYGMERRSGIKAKLASGTVRFVFHNNCISYGTIASSALLTASRYVASSLDIPGPNPVLTSFQHSILLA